MGSPEEKALIPDRDRGGTACRIVPLLATEISCQVLSTLKSLVLQKKFTGRFSAAQGGETALAAPRSARKDETK
jgi:hypothetical protein